MKVTLFLLLNRKDKLLSFKMNYCTLIIISCLLPAILAISLEKTRENGALRRRFNENNVPSSYKKAYNILKKANDLQARSVLSNNEADEGEVDVHAPGDNHDHDVDDGYDVVSNTANNQQLLSSEDVNAALHQVANSANGNGSPPPIDPQIKVEVSEILARTIDDINDRLFSLAENIRILSQSQLLLNARLSGVETSFGTALIPAVIAIQNQHQSQPEQPSSQDITTEINASPPEDEEIEDDGLQEHLGMVHQLLDMAATKIDDAKDIVEGEEEQFTHSAITQVQQETAMPPHNNGESQQATAIPPHNNEQQQQQQHATAMPPHNNEQRPQQPTSMPPHDNGEQQQTSAVPPHVEEKPQQATANPSHNNEEPQLMTAMPQHANGQQQQQQATTALPQDDGDSQQPPVDSEDTKDEKGFSVDHRRYSFRGYNPYSSDRRGDVLDRLRGGLSHRQVPARVPVLPLKRAPLDQQWYRKRYNKSY